MKLISAPTALAILLAVLFLPAGADLRAATIPKANNAEPLDQPSSWVGGSVPGTNDLAAFGSVNTTNSTPVTIGNGVSFLGIVATNNLGANLTLSGTGGSLTLGSGGIDLSAMTIWRTLNINSAIVLAADQTWTIGTNSSSNPNALNTTGVISGTNQLTIDSLDGNDGEHAYLRGNSTFSGGFVLGTNGAVRAGTADATVSGGAVTASALGAGSYTINGGIIFGNSGRVGSTNITINADFAVNSGAAGGANSRLRLFGALDMAGGERTVSLGRYTNSASAVLSSGMESLKFETAAEGPTTEFSNGTLRFVRDPAGGAGDYVSVRFEASTGVFNGDSGFTVGSNVITTFGSSFVFNTSGSLPQVVVEAGGYFNLSDNSNARDAAIQSLSGDGTVTSLAGSAATSTLTILPASGDNSVFSGRIVDGSSLTGLVGTAGGSMALVINGGGSQTLTGDNTYSGPTTVRSGTLILAATNGAAAGNSSAITVGAGGVLQIARADQIADTTPITLDGGELRVSNGASQTAGTLTVSAPSTITLDAESGTTLAFGSYSPTQLLTIRNLGDNTLTFRSDLSSAVTVPSLFAFPDGYSASWDAASGTFTIAEATPILLTVDNTKKQKMRYGLDYERLWFWYGPQANLDTVARWSMVDCDVDYIRVAINCDYELTEGEYNLAAYTDRIIPMMAAMKAAKPDIKFFASPRPLQDPPETVQWQPYPQWITGDNGRSFNFQWQKCAEYLVRYIKLMKSYGFKIDFMDTTNEWNFITATHIRDIKAYMLANLDADDVPLIIAPSTWSYAQGVSWLNGANTAAKKAAIDIAASHNTDRTGTARDFANAAANILPGKEVWNTELHGWKGSGPTQEIPTASYLFEIIRAGFSGINSWLAIGTTNQQHCYILNDGNTVTRNVKFFIFRKLSTTSNYGHALEVNQPAQLTATAALIRGNLMTVWVLNNNTNGVPVQITAAGRTLAETSVKRTRWNPNLALEGVSEQIPSSGDNSVLSTVAGNSLYCYEILLTPLGPPYTKIEAEAFEVQSGVATEACADEGGGQNVTDISHGDSLRFDGLAVGTGSAIRFRVARAAGTPDSRIEVREGGINGAVLGSIAVPVTGGAQVWETIEATLAPSDGSSSIILRFVENGSSLGTPLFNLNWIAPILPPVPNALTSAPTSTSQINLTWTAAPGAIGYALQRSTAPDGPYTDIGGTLTTNNYSDTGLSAGTRYHYVIRALYSDGVESSLSTRISSVPSAPFTPADTTSTAPMMGDDGVGGMKFTVTFPQSGIGKFYQALTAADLTNSSWSNASSVHMGTGGVLPIDIPIAPNESKRFYRVKVWRE